MKDNVKPTVDMNGYEVFFFDFDGVIADSMDIKTKAFAELYEPYGWEVMDKVTRHHLAHGGMSRYMKIRHYHNEFLGKEISENEVNVLAGRFAELVREKVGKAPLINGVLVFLQMLRDRDKGLFVVSGTPEQEIQKVIEDKQLKKFFIEVKGSPALKAENLEYLLSKYTLDVNETMFFGDSPEDMKAAVSLGMKFIPINYCEKEVDGYADFSDFMKNGVSAAL